MRFNLPSMLWRRYSSFPIFSFMIDWDTNAALLLFIWDRGLSYLKEALLHLGCCLNSNRSRPGTLFMKAPQNSKTLWRATGGECVYIQLIWRWLVCTMSSPWLKKRENYGGNIGKSKKSPENFTWKRFKNYQANCTEWAASSFFAGFQACLWSLHLKASILALTGAA